MSFRERLAKTLYEAHFEDLWADLHPNGIERAMWLGLARLAMELFEENVEACLRECGRVDAEVNSP